MKIHQVLGKAIFDYRAFFSGKDVDVYRDQISEFIKANSDLSNDEFCRKFEDQFVMTRVLHNALSREYLSRIASDVRVIKIILVIFTVLSVIGAIAIMNSMP